LATSPGLLNASDGSLSRALRGIPAPCHNPGASSQLADPNLDAGAAAHPAPRPSGARQEASSCGQLRGMFGSRRVGVNPRRWRLPQPVEGAWPALRGSGREHLGVADIAPPIGSEPKRVCGH